MAKKTATTEGKYLQVCGLRYEVRKTSYKKIVNDEIVEESGFFLYITSSYFGDDGGVFEGRERSHKILKGEMLPGITFELENVKAAIEANKWNQWNGNNAKKIINTYIAIKAISEKLEK